MAMIGFTEADDSLTDPLWAFYDSCMEAMWEDKTTRRRLIKPQRGKTYPYGFSEIPREALYDLETSHDGERYMAWMTIYDDLRHERSSPNPKTVNGRFKIIWPGGILRIVRYEDGHFELHGTEVAKIDAKLRGWW